MKVLVTGSSGHLGEALVHTLRCSSSSIDVVALDVLARPPTTHIGSITDREWVKQCMEGVEVVYHTATLHKPHVATHTHQAFVDTNITGTLVLLEAAVTSGSVKAFVFTSTTSVFGDALIPPADQPAAWITEAVQPIPKNIYGVTKYSAETLCQLYARNHELPCVILRTSRFFPEEDDDLLARQAYDDDNLKVNELLYRRVDIEDVVSAHLLAARRAPELSFGRYVITATTPWTQEDMEELRKNAPAALERRIPESTTLYCSYGWKMSTSIDRVYVNDLARAELGWQPKYDFSHALYCLQNGIELGSPLAKRVGSKGYHAKQQTATRQHTAD